MTLVLGLDEEEKIMNNEYLHNQETEETVEEELVVVGIVDCPNKLNIRSTPSRDAEILGTIKNGTEIMIDLEFETELFHKIYTPAGMEGFCAKEFIKVTD